MNNHELLIKIYEDIQGVKMQVRSVDKRLTGVEERLSSMEERFSNVEEQLAEVQEDTKITRTAVNTMLDWAEDPSIQATPLFKKAK
ncbi:MAG: hypothetical protein GX485_04630 [Clostridiales bacterium]|nr:hypothetical protein [Clostridiales bacterium]